MGTITLSALVMTAALQASGATIEGTVRSGSGTPLAGASVHLPDLDRTTLTDETGRYALGGVPPGPQHLTVSYLGHGARTIHALVPERGTLRVDVTLRPEPIPLEGLLVLGDIGASRTAGSQRRAPGTRTRTLAALRADPLLAEPDAFEALGGGPVALDPETPTRVHVRGGASDHTAFRLDGIPILDPVHAAGLFSAWSPDALSAVVLESPYASPALGDALGGTVSGWTRAPGARISSESRLSTSHASMTLRGPLGGGGRGYVASVRSGYPGAFAPAGEGSYLRGESGDGLLRLSGSLLGGEAVLLAYDAENELSASSATGDSGTTPGGAHLFEWASSSVGATWRREGAGTEADLRVWRATTRAHATWQNEPRGVDADRSDTGVQAHLRFLDATNAIEVGGRAGRVRSRYATEGAAPRRTLGYVSVFAEGVAARGSFEGRLGVSLLATSMEVRPAPRIQLARSGDRWSWAVSAGRSHQLTQSLRNPESVVGRVFGADPSVVAGTDDVPIPWADQLVLSVAHDGPGGVRLEAEAYARRLRDLVVVAPHETGPLSMGDWAVGDGTTQGASFALSSAHARYAWLIGYAWQRVRLTGADVAYVPEHGTRHRLDAGLSLHASPTVELRLGAKAIVGRPATDVAGSFEWEACNLLDRGCEFAGSPATAGPLGSRRLPAYVRVDVGGRKHWHLALRGRDHLVALYGTVTNVLGRGNLLAFVRDPLTDALSSAEMRPPSPLVLGLEWRF